MESVFIIIATLKHTAHSMLTYNLLFKHTNHHIAQQLRYFYAVGKPCNKVERMWGGAMQDVPGCKDLSCVTAAADTIMHADKISTNTITHAFTCV